MHILGLPTGSAKMLNFENPRWQKAAILKVENCNIFATVSRIATSKTAQIVKIKLA